jgi:hypothetical protein
MLEESVFDGLPKECLKYKKSGTISTTFFIILYSYEIKVAKYLTVRTN